MGARGPGGVGPESVRPGGGAGRDPGLPDGVAGQDELIRQGEDERDEREQRDELDRRLAGRNETSEEGWLGVVRGHVPEPGGKRRADLHAGVAEVCRNCAGSQYVR
jgi:hypothetical protein